MKRFRQFLQEVFHAGDNVAIHGSFANSNKGYCEVFRNPSLSELSQVQGLTNTCRGFVDLNGTLFIWSPDYFHFDVIDKFHLAGDDTKYSDLPMVNYDRGCPVFLEKQNVFVGESEDSVIDDVSSIGNIRNHFKKSKIKNSRFSFNLRMPE